jgi:hypothetical protein
MESAAADLCMLSDVVCSCMHQDAWHSQVGKNKQTAQGGGRYAQILMSRVGFKELIMLRQLYHTFENALRDRELYRSKGTNKAKAIFTTSKICCRLAIYPVRETYSHFCELATSTMHKAS